MFEMVGKKLNFRLIDFDNAKKVTDSTGQPAGPTAKHRTGTLPFMAAELNLDASLAQKRPEVRVPVKHLLRHDFTSVFLLSVWCAEILPVDNAPKGDVLQLIEKAKSLEKGGLFEIASHKVLLCEKGLKFCEVFLPPAAHVLYRWFKPWSKLFSAVSRAREDHDEDVADAQEQGLQPPTWDDETCNGVFTYAKLVEALKKVMPAEHEFTPDEIALVTGVSLAQEDEAGPSKPVGRGRKTKNTGIAEAATSGLLDAVDGFRARLCPRKIRPQQS